MSDARTPRQPMQPVIQDAQDVPRFRANPLVRYLLDHGGLSLNDLATVEATQDDQEQFAQLIGYSLSGYAELSWASDDSYKAAVRIHERGETPEQAQLATLEEELQALRTMLREPIARLYGIHPDDLMGE